MECNHEIIIDNFQSGETVSYSIVIIKGTIKNHCQDDKIYINSSTPFKIMNSTFKILHELKFGQNLIKLKYCCTNSQITMTYSLRETPFTVLPLYIICDGHDGRFQAPSTDKNDIQSALARITLGSKLLQSVFAEKLFEGNHGRKTFRLEDDCRVFRSCLNFSKARKMSQRELWTVLSGEIIASEMEHDRIKFMGFLSCTRYCGEKFQEDFNHEDIVGITEAYVALGGGGLALFGTACLYTWPENLSEVVKKFQDFSPVRKREFMDDSCYRGTLGACFSTTLGSVLHELCHTFDLGHTENGIMGRGFDDIFKVFTNNFDNNAKSDIWKAHEKSLQFNEKSGKTETSLGKVSSTKNRNIEKVEDGTFWTRSCLTFLAYHRWLNNNSKPQKTQIKFSNLTKVVSSTSGLRVIELRDEENGIVLLNWVFDGRILKYSFQLPEEELQHDYKYVMFVEDNVGNILKHDVKIESK